MSICRIEVKSPDVQVREGTSRSGRPYKLTEQRGWLHGSKDYPTEVSWLLENGQIPFAAGFYVVDARCVETDRFGQVGLKLSRMVPERPAK